MSRSASSRNAAAHLSRKSRRTAAAARRAGFVTGVPLFSDVVAAAIKADAKARREARMAAECAAAMDTAATYRPIM
jgi:hypothetical protein